MGRQNSSSPSRIRSSMVVWGWFRRFRRGGLYLAEKEAKEPVCVRRRRWVWFLEKSWHACWVASQLLSGSMYMGKGGVKAAVLTCSFDLSLGCHAGRDEKGETLLQVCLCTQGTGVKSTKVLRNKGGSRRLWGYVPEHLQAFWEKKISSCKTL